MVLITFFFQYLVQQCESGINTQPHEDSLTIFVRRWHADKLELGPFEEITLDSRFCQIM